jgi:malonate transporter and related proteins
VVVIDVALPIFGIVGAGYLVGRLSWLGPTTGKSLNDFVYYVALPVFLFFALARAPLREIADWRFIAANLLGVAGSFVLGAALAYLLFKKDLAGSAIQGMAASYGTTGYMGVPLVITAFGPTAALPAAVATLLHNIPAIATVIVMCEVAGASGDKQPGRVARHVAHAILRNPLTVALVAGLAVAALPTGLPKPILVFSEMLGQTAGPCALFALGLGLASQTVKTFQSPGHLLDVAAVVGIKILVQPLVTFLAAAYLFRTDPFWMKIAVLMAALPVGAGVYVFATRYRTHVTLVSQAIVVSMLAAMGTISAVLALDLAGN